MIRVVLCIVLATLGGCLNTLYNNHYAQLTSEDKSYLEKVWVQQKSFDVDKSEDGICWIRACNWITKYSRSPIENISDNAIMTHKPTNNEYSYWFSVTRGDAPLAGVAPLAVVEPGNRVKL